MADPDAQTIPTPVLILFQAEWCPLSSAVRERLTELMLTFIAVPVEPRPEERHAMRTAVGTDTIPVAVLADGTVLDGDAEEIIAELDARFPEGPDAAEHRAQALAHARG
jgi:glutaredoxin